MKKLIKVLPLVLAFAGISNAFAALPAVIKIGNDPTYAPFEVKNAKGEFEGFDIDIANAICEREKLKCVFVESDFDALIPSLKAKKIDAIISSLSITPQREKEVLFSDKVFAANPRLIAAKGSNLLPTVESLRGKRVGVQQGTTQEAYALKKWQPNGVEVVPYVGQDQVYNDLVSGRLDASFQDESAGSFGFLKLPLGKDYAFAGAAVKDLEFFGVGTGLAVRLGDTELKAAFDKGLAEIRKDGTYDKLAKKYFDFNIYGD